MTRNIVIGILVIGIGAGGLLLYFDRPTAPPSGEVRQPQGVADNLQDDTGTAVFRIVPEESEARFVIDEVLRGNEKTVVGTTTRITGDIAVNPEEPDKSEIGTIRVNARTFNTDSDGRNRAITRFILKAENPENEFITFDPTGISGLPNNVPVGERAPFDVTGDLTVAGATREVTFSGAAQLAGDNRLTAAASTTIQYADFGISIPDVPFVASVADEVTLAVDIVAEQASSSPKE